MDMGLTALTNRLAAGPYYSELFTAVFGSSEITTDRMSQPQAQLVRPLVSSESKHDSGVVNGFSNFTAEENRGRRIFLGRVGSATCAACPGSDNFAPGNNINNNGLDSPYADKGWSKSQGHRRTKDFSRCRHYETLN